MECTILLMKLNAMTMLVAFGVAIYPFGYVVMSDSNQYSVFSYKVKCNTPITLRRTTWVIIGGEVDKGYSVHSRSYISIHIKQTSPSKTSM